MPGLGMAAVHARAPGAAVGGSTIPTPSVLTFPESPWWSISRRSAWLACMQGPPGSTQPAVKSFTIRPPSVLIFGNPSLYDVAALSKLGQCGSNPSSEAGDIFIEVCARAVGSQATPNEEL